MADNPTISVDISVMLEKLQTELRRAEDMVAASAGRINASLGMGGGVGGAGVPGVTAASAAASAGAASPMPPSSFVPSAAGQRVGMMGGSGGFAAGAMGGMTASRMGRSMLMRFAGPTAIAAAGYQGASALHGAWSASLSQDNGFVDALMSNVPDTLVEGLVAMRYGPLGLLFGQQQRAVEYRQRRDALAATERRTPISEALREEISGLDFSRRMSEMDRVGDTRGMEQMIIQRTVTEALQQAETLRAAGISPEMIERRNEAIARSLAEELGGTTGGVEEFATAAGMFRTGSATADRTNEILTEIQSMMRQVTETIEGVLIRDAIQSGAMATVGSIG